MATTTTVSAEQKTPWHTFSVDEACGLSLVTTFLITVLGFMNRIFATTPLDLTQWVLCIAVGSVMIWVIEGMKFFRRRGESQRPQQASFTPTMQQAGAAA